MTNGDHIVQQLRYLGASTFALTAIATALQTQWPSTAIDLAIVAYLSYAIHNANQKAQTPT